MTKEERALIESFLRDLAQVCIAHKLDMRCTTFIDSIEATIEFDVDCSSGEAMWRAIDIVGPEEEWQSMGDIATQPGY